MDAAAFYSQPAALSALPDHPALADLPSDVHELRAIVQNLLVHRDWAVAYGIAEGDVRSHEQHLRSVTEVLGRAFEISHAPLSEPRPPIDRVLSICRHYALLHTAFLRSHGTPARVRCGFANYFDRSKWVDHWVTEWWDGDRWVRHDPQVDDLQTEACGIEIDPYDQPAGDFLPGADAWIACRAGELDPDRFGIFDMAGMPFVAGNVVADLAALNKVELLPWDWWGIIPDPYEPLPDEAGAVFDDLAELVASGDHDAIRARYDSDDRVHVPADILSFQDGTAVEVHLDL